MYLARHIPNYKKTVLGLSLATTLAATTIGIAQAAPTAITARFDMYGSNGVLIGSEVDNSVVGNYDAVAETFALSSSDPFYGTTWTASGGTLYAPGTYVIGINGDGGNECTYDPSNVFACNNTAANGDGSYTFVVPAGHIGGNINFAWGVNSGIDVFLVWDSNGNSVDVDGSGVPGNRMLDGPFVGFSANFSLSEQPQIASFIPVSLTVTPTPIDITANVVVDTGIAGGVYDWTGTDAAILAAEVGGPNLQTLTFTPGGIAAGNYTIKATVTKGPGTGTHTITVTIPSSLSAVNDTDGDGSVDLNDGGAGQGGQDADGDGIPNWLDPIGNTATQLQTVNTDTNSLVITTSAGGTLALGSLGSATNLSPLVTAADTGATDSDILSSCIGGCFDFKVNGLAAGASTQVVLPLSAAIPQHAVYRKFSSGSWTGYKICGPSFAVLCDNPNDTNSIASAEATGAGASQCPAPGNSAYTPGLTPGHFCVQLTMTDGGPNDEDGIANGTIVDPGGIGQIYLTTPTTGVGGGGCSLSSKVANPLERSDWWLLIGFLAALGIARRKCNC